MMTVSNDQIIRDILNETELEALTENQRAELENVIDDEEISNVAKSGLIMDILELGGSNNRKAILETLDTFTF